MVRAQRLIIPCLVLKTACCLLLALIAFIPAAAEALPGLDSDSAGDASAVEDNNKSANELIAEAEIDMLSERPIDARAKLQRAISLAPEDYRAYVRLGLYYLSEVGHFKMAYQYLMTAEKLFAKKHGSDLDGTLDDKFAQEHAQILRLRSEAELNLDRYSESLATLDRFAKLYWSGWYPGSRAWVLMKLKRIDEAIKVAQEGLLRGADSRQTWNILGILLSDKGSRELSLQAFEEAINAEMLTGGAQVATPLNNAGEVYREMFQDRMAEACWLRSLRLPDGCDHILPSLNLSILDVDELRLHEADRALQNFEACFAQQKLREDTEHRTLIALGRGRIALHKNDVDEALKLLVLATEEQQWFGKIGTNEADVRFAATIAMAQAISAKAAALRDTARDSFWERLADLAQVPLLELRSWWLNRTARKVGLEELDDLKDLFIRNTDTMLEYPTLGTLLATLDTDSFKKRLDRMAQNDSRKEAKNYYQLYLASNLLQHGKSKEALPLLEDTMGKWRSFDRLAKAETLVRLIQAKQDQAGWIWGLSRSKQEEIYQLQEALYALLPSHLRFYNLALPVSVQMSGEGRKEQNLSREIAEELTKARFFQLGSTGSYQTKYALIVTTARNTAPEGGFLVSLQLVSRKDNSGITSQTAAIAQDRTGKAEVINNFIAKAFSHQLDPAGEVLPAIPIIQGLLSP